MILKRRERKEKFIFSIIFLILRRRPWCVFDLELLHEYISSEERLGSYLLLSFPLFFPLFLVAFIFPSVTLYHPLNLGFSQTDRNS